MRLYSLAGELRKNGILYDLILFGEVENPRNLRKLIGHAFEGTVCEGCGDDEDLKRMWGKLTLRLLEHFEEMDKFMTIYKLELRRKMKELTLSLEIGGKERVFKLKDGGRITVGRGEGNDLKLDERFLQVSRKHCAIIFKDGNLYIEDLGSKNGTFIGRKGSKALEPHRPHRIGWNEIVILSNLEMRIKVLERENR